MEYRIIDFGDLARQKKRFEGAASAGEFTLPAMIKIGADMMEVEKKVFSSRGRRGGGSWQRLSDDTARKKGSDEIFYTDEAREGYSALGDDTLVKSLTVPNAPFQIFDVLNTVITFGTERPYADVLASGGGRNVPPRPFLKFTRYDIDRWTDYLAEHLIRGYTRVG